VILTGAGQNRVAHRVRTSHWASAKRCTANSGGKVAVAGYRIERSMGCENAASQNMFLNISKCYLNILFVLFHLRPDRQTDRVTINGDYLSTGDGERLCAPITHL
jgi:hypothetical protein